MAIQRITSPEEMRYVADKLRNDGRTLGFVPTMGYLHEGHASLIRLAGTQADIVALSVFVNPTQFGPNEDYEHYPRDAERDERIAAEAGASLLFLPEPDSMYPEQFSTVVSVTGISAPFEGKFRPDHFNGVSTVVTKLLTIVNPHVAVFGRKDYQQCLVVQRLVADLNLPVRVIIGPTLREADGLAMSSRNAYLSDRERHDALCLYRALIAARDAIRKGVCNRGAIENRMLEVLTDVADIAIEYASAARADTLRQPDAFSPGESIVLLLAVRIGKTRLIDNMVVEAPS